METTSQTEIAVSYVMTEQSIAAYVQHEVDRGVSQRTIRNSKRVTQSLWEWLPEDKTITKDRLQEWRQSLKDHGYTAQTELNYVKGINRYLDFVGLSEFRFNRGRPKDIAGKQFGYLTAIEPTGEKNRKDYIWRCRCKCGKEVEYPATRLLLGNTVSCGCLRGEHFKEVNKYIGGTSLRQSIEEQVHSTRAKSGYIVRHYEGTEQKNAIITWEEESESTLTHTLAPGIQVYSVLARYEETDNYLPSECVSATFPFLFQDGFILYVKAGAGITVEESFDETAKLLKLSLNDGYYLYNSNTADNTQYDITIRPVTESDVSSSEWDKIKSHTSGADKITYEAVDGADNTSTTLKLNTQGTSTGETYTAILEIGTAKQKTSIVGKIKEKEHFSDFAADENPTISWDSAFTVYYEVTNFDADTYQQPVLEFSSKLPVGTTIIFRDQNDGSYWYKKVDAATHQIWLDADKCQISLDAFNPMVSQTTPYTAASGKLRLQFIVDFSQSSSKVSGNGVDVTLNVERKDGKPDTVENLSSALHIGLGETVFNLEAGDVSADDLVENLRVSAHADGGASAYDHRDLSLVLTPGDSLPKDAYIRMTRDGINSDWRPGADGRIIIPVGNFPVASSQIALELVSKMFPQTEKTYKMSASLYLSSTDAGVAPFSISSQQTDPNLIGGPLELTFVSNQNETGISIEVAGDKRLYTSQDSMQVEIVTTPEDYDEAYNVTIELHKELDGTSYGNTLIKPIYDSENGSYTFDLSQCVDGDYCVVAFFSTKGDMIVNEAEYYFIIQNPTN